MTRPRTELRVWLTGAIIVLALVTSITPAFGSYDMLADFGGEELYVPSLWPFVLMASLASLAAISLLVCRVWSPVAFLTAAVVPPFAAFVGTSHVSASQFALPQVLLACSAWRLRLHVSSFPSTHEPEEPVHGRTQEEA